MQNSFNKDQASSSSALTPSQEEYSKSSGAFLKYRRLTSGTDNILCWLVVEFYNLFFAPLPGILGIIFRTLFLPFMLEKNSKIPKIEKNVSLRSPLRIKFGSSVIVDQSSIFDARFNGNKANHISLGNNCFIGAFSMILAKRGDIFLGNGTNVSTNCRIASEGDIKIGESVLVSAYCYIGPGNHKIKDLSVPIVSQGMEEGRGVVIGDNTWVGAHSTILDGVTIGKNVVIGAHSFVRDDVPDNAIVGGVPAKIIKMR